jgi:lipopolysaccharide biosynthesis glycosyltransferase
VTKPLKIYIGWDSREDIAYQVAKLSIENHASVPVEIIPLKQKKLRKEGLYWREIDKLASTEFTFTRFLIPELNKFNGWALFIDCDFVFLDDVKKLFDQADDRYAVMCAQHDYTPAEGIKMDKQKQTVYPRKNWSSMMLINCGHPDNQCVTKEFVNDQDKTGAYLHRFSWLSDKKIGKLSHKWNWLVGWYKEPDDGKPKALHYTEGGPWFEKYADCEYATEWYKVERKYLKNCINDLSFPDINELSLTDQKKKLINAALDYIIDPTGRYYNVNKDKLYGVIDDSMNNKVAAIYNSDISFFKNDYKFDQYLQSFVIGSGGYISNWENEKSTSTELVIRGLSSSSQEAIRHCWKTKRTFYAIDTGYFGNRGKIKTWHRITKNNLQHLGPIISRPADRLKRILDYRYQQLKPGSKILICPPSDKVMSLWNQPDPTTWTNQVIEELKQYTDRPVEVRLKPERNERVSTNTIESALANDVYCLVTYNSIAATEALIFGKPAIALGPNAAQMLCNTVLSEIENLKYPNEDEMIAFMRHLSYTQFTRQEMQDGTAWRIINESS